MKATKYYFELTNLIYKHTFFTNKGVLVCLFLHFRYLEFAALQAKQYVIDGILIRHINEF